MTMMLTTAFNQTYQKTLIFLFCCFMATPSLANNHIKFVEMPNSYLEVHRSIYEETLEKLCPGIPELVEKLYKNAWLLSYKSAIVHVKKEYYKKVPTGTPGAELLESVLEDEVYYVLISQQEDVAIDEVIRTTSEACYSTFDNTW